MKFFQKILSKLNGLYYPQEYLCTVKEEHSESLHVFLLRNNSVVKNITNCYSFVGYSPLIFALPPVKEINLHEHNIIKIVYSSTSLSIGAIVSKKDIVAMLQLKKIKEQKIDQSSFYYFEGIKGEHKFLSSFHQLIHQLNNELYNKKRGNVFLENNLYKQVQIAYAIPRIISLITVSSNGLYNLFPTDLHGQINDGYYIISLRYEGNACKQVEATKKIVLCNINACCFKEVYSLGKNHMQPLKQKSNFNFSDIQTQLFEFPLPLHTLEYKELELKDAFIHGIHKLLLFKILSHKQINNSVSTLAHVHNVYATWRYRNKVTDSYLIR